MTYPNTALNTTWTYDLGAFGKGRLSNITRNGETIDYGYDRFGRTLQDGALTYGYDKNGNRASITYPGSVAATYTHDFADREATLQVQVGANPAQTLVSAAGYEPFGPLASLALGNGLIETRSFDARYAPSEIKVDGTGTLLRWSYTTDPVGNISTITDLVNAANNRTYGYQDPQYFLTLGNGPWGTRSWTYDKIGNRLTETKGGVTDTYGYFLNGTGGHTPKLSTITHGGSTFSYGYDAVGNVVSDGTQPFSYADDRRMSQVGQGGAGSATSLAYDGRGYLSQSVFEPPGALHTDDTLPTYSSEGLLYHRFAHQSLNPFGSLSTLRDSDLYVFYFAGRPVATLDKVAQGRPGALLTTSTWQYLTADHLGTPILAANPAGALVWQGGFEPFGGDYSGAATPLRFPGQWFDATWNSNKDVGLYYNVHRWYGAGVGRYSQPDFIGLQGGLHLFSYSFGNPLLFSDRLGLRPSDQECCAQAFEVGLFHEESGDDAGGIVVCCEGKRVPCANPGTGNPMFDLPGELLLANCAVEHETDHFDDVPCPPDCKLARPNFRFTVSQRKAECSASKVEVACLRRSQALCGSNQTCLARLNKRIANVVAYGNLAGKCQGLR